MINNDENNIDLKIELIGPATTDDPASKRKS